MPSSAAPVVEPGRRGRLGLVLSLLVAVAGASLLAGLIPGGDGGVGRPRVLPELPVTAMNRTAGVSNNSPALVADPADPRVVVMANRQDAPDFGCALQVSGDSGRTWLSAEPVATLPAGADKCYAPEVAFDRHGRLYYLFVGLQGAGNEPMGAFLATSTDGGSTFTPARRVLGPLNFAVRMAIDPSRGGRGRLHLVWLKATSDPPTGGFGPPPNPIMTAYSDNGGRSFSRPVQVSDRTRQRVVAPALAIGRDGAVHVAYYDLRDDAIDYQGLEGAVWEEPWSLIVSSSRDGGRRFARGVVADAKVVAHERVMLIFTMPAPSLVADRSGTMCLAWTDARLGDADVFARCAGPDGRWRAAQRVNDDPEGNGRVQYLPRLSLAPGGRVDAIFFDRRVDPENQANNVFYTFSSDGGRRFASNRRVTTEASDTRIGPEYSHAAAAGQYEFGSRLALLSERRRVLAAWNDTRNIPRRPGATAQDLFATVIRLPNSGSGSARRGLGAGLLAVGAVAACIDVTRRRRRPEAGPVSAL